MLYKRLKPIKRFGRTGRFDFLALLLDLHLISSEPVSCYLKGATGPRKGAIMLWGNRPIGQLDCLAMELSQRLGISPLPRWRMHFAIGRSDCPTWFEPPKQTMSTIATFRARRTNKALSRYTYWELRERRRLPQTGGGLRPAPLAACTIARMPARSASGRLCHASATSANSASNWPFCAASAPDSADFGADRLNSPGLSMEFRVHQGALPRSGSRTTGSCSGPNRQSQRLRCPTGSPNSKATESFRQEQTVNFNLIGPIDGAVLVVIACESLQDGRKWVTCRHTSLINRRHYLCRLVHIARTPVSSITHDNGSGTPVVGDVPMAPLSLVSPK